MTTTEIRRTTRQTGSIQWEKIELEIQTRETARCKLCKAAKSRVQVTIKVQTYRSDMGYIGATRKPTVKGRFSCCGQTWPFLPVKGALMQEKPCSARCVNAVGHSCECSCAGMNHGKAHE